MGNVNDTLFKNIEALGSLANKYTNNKSLTNLLVFMYIRQFNSSYTGSTWDQVGGKIDVEFVDYVKNSNPENMKNTMKRERFSVSSGITNLKRKGNVRESSARNKCGTYIIQ